MRVEHSRRTPGYPSMTDRRYWRRYAAGMATEVLFIVALTAVGLAIAVAATVIWR